MRCALLEIPVDPGRLYDCADSGFLIWLDQLTERMSAENRKQQQKAKRGG
jgi:hypothetical protein